MTDYCPLCGHGGPHERVLDEKLQCCRCKEVFDPKQREDGDPKRRIPSLFPPVGKDKDFPS